MSGWRRTFISQAGNGSLQSAGLGRTKHAAAKSALLGILSSCRAAWAACFFDTRNAIVWLGMRVVSSFNI